MLELDDPLKSCSGIGWMSRVRRLCFETKFESKKQCVDLESMRVMMLELGIRSEVSRVRNIYGFLCILFILKRFCFCPMAIILMPRAGLYKTICEHQI